MQTVCTIDDWLAEFVKYERSTTRRNGPAFEIPLGLGHATVTPLEKPPGWYRFEMIYPASVVRNNRDGVPWTDFDPGFNSPLSIWQRMCGRIWGYRRALEKAKARGVEL